MNEKKIGSKINFKTSGRWVFVFSNDENNTDERIFEFHMNMPVFLNVKEKFKIEGQCFLNKSQRVIVFFKDRDPIIASSIMNYSDYQYSSVYQITEYLEQEIESTPDILDHVNQFPFMKLSRDYTSNVHLLWDLPGSLEENIVTDYKTQFNFEYEETEFNEFFNAIIQVTFDLQMTNNDIVLKDTRYADKLADELDQYEEIRNNYYTNILPKQSGLQMMQYRVGNILKGLEFFAHKLIRAYFFSNTPRFLRTLFEGYELNVSTFSDLFEKNINIDKSVEIFNLKNFSEMRVEGNIDIGFDGVLMNENDFNNAQKVNRYFQCRLSFIDSNLKDLVSLMFSGLFQLTQQNRKAYKDFTDYSFLRTFVAIYRKFRFNNLYSQYLPIIKNGFLSLNALKKNDLQNLDKPKNLAELRRRLVLLGYLKFDPSIDQDFLMYKDFQIFEKQDRLLI